MTYRIRIGPSVEIEK